MSDTYKSNGFAFLTALFGSQAKASVICELFGENTDEIYISELVRRSGMAEQGVDQQLRNLLTLELVVTRTDASRRYYRANVNHPAYGALRELATSSVGLVPALRSAVSILGVECAFIFGSIARGEEHAQSDIDLMVIGYIPGPDLSGRLRGIMDRFGRELNYCLYTPQEFALRVAENNHFVRDVLAGKKIFVRHDQAALDRLTGK